MPFILFYKVTANKAYDFESRSMTILMYDDWALLWHLKEYVQNDLLLHRHKL